jgi:alpha-N-arabinofuranosidase
VLRVQVEAPTYATERYGDVPLLDAVATHDPATGEVVVLVVNRGRAEALDLEVGLAGFGELSPLEAWTVGGDDPYARNTADQPDRVRPEPLDARVLTGGTLSTRLPPVSWSVIRLGPVEGAPPAR